MPENSPTDPRTAQHDGGPMQTMSRNGSDAEPRRAIRRSRRTGNWLLGIVFAVGLGVFLFPMVADAINSFSQTTYIRAYDEKVDTMSEAEKAEAKRSADARNRELAGEAPAIADPFPEAGPGPQGVSNVDLSALDEPIGHLEIPAIDVHLPIFEGDGEAVLRRGIGHIPNTSLPVGGASTRAVLTGHRGQPTATLFRNLDEMALGDTFYVHTLGETLAYEVVAIDVIEPTDFGALRIEDGRDLVTLLTCTPYMINSHRLLVTGERVPYTPGATEVLPPVVGGWLGQWGPWLLALLLMVAVLAVAGVVRNRRRNHRPAR